MLRKKKKLALAAWLLALSLLSVHVVKAFHVHHVNATAAAQPHAPQAHHPDDCPICQFTPGDLMAADAPCHDADLPLAGPATGWSVVDVPCMPAAPTTSRAPPVCPVLIAYQS